MRTSSHSPMSSGPSSCPFYRRGNRAQDDEFSAPGSSSSDCEIRVAFGLTSVLLPTGPVVPDCVGEKQQAEGQRDTGANDAQDGPVLSETTHGLEVDAL